MCGIYGIHNGPSSVAHALGRDMVRRGPDAQGVHSAGPATVGMNRLHLWGDPASQLPFLVDERYAVLNGEIYGYLGRPAGAVEAYEENFGGGEDEIRFLSKHADPSGVDGMYCVAEMDPMSGDLRLTRDRFGIKPVYYCVRPDGGLAFSSCIRSLFLPEVGMTREIDADSLFDTFAFGFPLTSQTPFVGVSELLPGWELQVNSNLTSASPRASFDLGITACAPPDRDHLRKTVERAVKSCAKTDYPLGLAVSGGVDSTILAHVMNAAGLENVTTFSVVLEEVGDGVSDLRELGLPAGGVWETWKHRHVTITRDTFLRHMFETTAQFAFPTDMHSMPLYAALAEIVEAENIRVLLTGEGADEYFMGYDKYRSYSGPPHLASYYLQGQKGAFLKELFDARVMDKGIARANSYSKAEFHGVFLENLRNLEVRARLHKLLLRTDLVLMERSIEGRTPFLHGGLPELAMSCAPKLLLGVSGKQPLRDAYADEICDIVKRPKKRFKAPDQLFWDVFADLRVRETLFAPLAGAEFDFSETKVKKILDAYATGNKSDLSELLFLIFTTKKVMEAS